MGILTAVWEAIPVYTGLSPVTFFTLVSLLMAGYYILTSLFAPPPFKYVPMEPLSPPVQLGTVTEEELKAYDGNDKTKPLLMAIKGNIYDVTQSRGFYGPGGAYSLFAGRDASKALAKMSFEEKDLTGDISELTPDEHSTLNDWEEKFMSKYHKVGEILKPKSSHAEEASEEVTGTNDTKDIGDETTTNEAEEAPKDVVPTEEPIAALTDETKTEE